MYAIIESGGKQYRVQQGDLIDVELLKEKEGSVSFDKVLFVNDETPLVGEPVVAGYKVMGEIIEETKGPKVINFRYRRRKDSKRKVGHRQKYARVKITEITKGEGHGS